MNSFRNELLTDSFICEASKWDGLFFKLKIFHNGTQECRQDKKG